MSNSRSFDDVARKQCVDLEVVRKLEITYDRTKPGKVELAVEYVGGRMRVLEVDRYLIERLLERIEDQEA
ncbi:MAG TPA: hypothetical protein VFJ72_16665 [Rubrobacteraceae bacterium]|nr:hypothetical protein [Rubrobacteraceae bacterium]